jgi:hypothetical protein
MGKVLEFAKTAYKLVGHVFKKVDLNEENINDDLYEFDPSGLCQPGPLNLRRLRKRQNVGRREVRKL